jgi:hypothetical protein
MMELYQEEMKATETMHLHIALQDCAYDVLHGDPEGVMYDETIGALKDRFGDQPLAVG